MKQIFLILLLSSCFVSAVNAQVCESLFGDSGLYRTIQSLAELRLKLDLAQTSSEDTITTSLLTMEYEKKEKALLKYISRENLLKLMKFEIEKLQKAADSSKKDRVREQKIIEDSIPGLKVQFYKFKSETTNLEAFHLMSTPVTQVVWQKIGQLINSKEFLPRPLSLNPAIAMGDLLPVANVSFIEVMTWIHGLNKLSAQGNAELAEIIKEHKSGDTYTLPSMEQWKVFFDEITIEMVPKTKDSLKANPELDVGTASPVIIQGNPFFGFGLFYFLKNCIKGYTSPSFLGQYKFSNALPDQNSNYLTFRLVRERKQP